MLIKLINMRKEDWIEIWIIFSFALWLMFTCIIFILPDFLLDIFYLREIIMVLSFNLIMAIIKVYSLCKEKEVK